MLNHEPSTEYIDCLNYFSRAAQRSKLFVRHYVGLSEVWRQRLYREITKEYSEDRIVVPFQHLTVNDWEEIHYEKHEKLLKRISLIIRGH